MRKQHLPTILLLSTLLILAACTKPLSRQASANDYVKISAEELAERIDDPALTLVNVHIPYEGDLPKTDLSIPYNEIAQHLSELPDVNAPIVIYCLSGGMSTVAAKELVSRGYTNVIELDGGMAAWATAGYELIRQ